MLDDINEIELNNGSKEQHPIHFRGRRHGRRLRPNLANLINEDLPKVRINRQTPIENPLELFPRGINDIWMEIGFGAGEHIAQQAEINPSVGFIGCEPFINGVASLLRYVTNKKLPNVRILPDDVRPFLSLLPDHSISRLFILFPDPWRKKRHHSRRIIQRTTLNEFNRLLKVGGELRIATDHPEYLRWILIHLKNNKGFRWLARRPTDWRLRPEDWPETRYEKKALLAGRSPIFLQYKKI